MTCRSSSCGVVVMTHSMRSRTRHGRKPQAHSAYHRLYLWHSICGTSRCSSPSSAQAASAGPPAELLVTQPAVSERVRHLERVVGIAGLRAHRTRRRADSGGRATSPLRGSGARRSPTKRSKRVRADRALSPLRRRGALDVRTACRADGARRARSLPPPSRRARRALARRGGAGARRRRRIGFAIPARARRGLRRVSLGADPGRVRRAHPAIRWRAPAARRSTCSATTLLAVNAWGDGAEPFLDAPARASASTTGASASAATRRRRSHSPATTVTSRS